ncbi:hypothetical protein [Paenibacillus eucommiae]|uniref:Tissue inhibitor of metalloproteinase n=1 Tax=Paenibacillus eucommiae TaxID=1355755 RepID=A0ABS4J6H8_9BACL|nr:hypothetical protein [Paenibacillus eucommiae]MBP1994394.1 hypothetical protein [Paenibacillus eucommiae]
MKRTIHSILLFCLVVSFMAIFSPAPAYACSCAMPQTVEAQFNHSEAVFAGRVIEVKEDRSLGGRISKSALFELSQIWKGGSESQLIIQTGSGGGDCGYNFEEGKDYLVYAHPSTMYSDKEALVTIICDRTNVIDQAQEDLAILGKGKAPTEHVNLKGEFDRAHPYVWFALSGVVLVGMIIFFVWRRVRR